MSNYAVSNSTGITFGSTKGAMTTTFRTICLTGNGSSNAAGGFSGATAPTPFIPRRGKLYDVLIGTDTTPGDTVVYWDVARATVTNSSATWIGVLSSGSSNFALDQADAPANSYLLVNSSAETNLTYGSEIWSVGINQRASYRWVAAPGSEMVWPATSSAGLGLRAMGPSGGGSFAGNVTATVLIQEQ